ncbi:hypothetical protein D3C81_1858960 [compost metagenome]
MWAGYSLQHRLHLVVPALARLVEDPHTHARFPGLHRHQLRTGLQIGQNRLNQLIGFNPRAPAFFAVFRVHRKTQAAALPDQPGAECAVQLDGSV